MNQMMRRSSGFETSSKIVKDGAAAGEDSGGLLAGCTGDNNGEARAAAVAEAAQAGGSRGRGGPLRRAEAR